MTISKHKVVHIDYTLTSDEGQVIDTSVGRQPLAYIQGIGNLIPGMEEALEGKTVGDEFEVKISPDKGYGQRHPQLVQTIDRANFGGVEKIDVGMQFQTQGQHGPMVVTVTEVTGDKVTIDGNHPLAGQNLNFKVAVREIREATAEELDHGHVHGPGGHHH